MQLDWCRVSEFLSINLMRLVVQTHGPLANVGDEQLKIMLFTNDSNDGFFHPLNKNIGVKVLK